MFTLTTRVMRRGRKRWRLQSRKAGRRPLKNPDTVGTRYRNSRKTTPPESAPATSHSLRSINSKSHLSKESFMTTFVHEAVRKQETIHPDRPAVIDRAAHAINYAELCTRSRALAQRLQQLGIKADDRVAIWMDRSIDFVVSILGVLNAGAAYVPIDTSFPEERVLLILENSGARVV